MGIVDVFLEVREKDIILTDHIVHFLVKHPLVTVI